MDQHIVADAFGASREEVGWFYAASGGAMGLRAQSIGDSSPGVWDDAKIHRAHMALRTVGHRADVAKMSRVVATISQLEPEHRNDLAAVYVPFGASRTTWQAYCVFTKERRSLLGLALRTPELAKAFGRVHELEGDVAIPEVILLRWIENEVAHLKPEKIRQGHSLPTNHRLGPALREADRRESLAIGLYEVLRRKRIETRQAENQELLDRELKALHIRLWGAA